MGPHFGTLVPTDASVTMPCVSPQQRPLSGWSEQTRRLIVGIALATACSDRPPPPIWSAASLASANEPSSSAALPDADALTEPLATYPLPPPGPPPVPPPNGRGLAVPFGRYLVVDQFGYRRKMTKVAVLADPVRGWNQRDAYVPSATLEIRRWSDGSTEWTGRPLPWNGGAIDEASGDRGAWLNFTPFDKPGLYYVYDPKADLRSNPFTIDDDVYRPVLKAATKMYYFNRANAEKKPPSSCVGARCWSLDAAYVGKGQDREARSVRDRDNPKTARDLSGGWWDAGDTNKYVTFANEAVQQLLTAYDEHPAAFTDDFGIPESGNGVPDLLDELLVEIGWLEKMQPADLKGGVLIKVGELDFSSAIPDRDRAARYYYPEPCSSATIVASGMFAHAALVLQKFPSLSARAAELRERARSAWTHFSTNPKSESCDDMTIKAGDADRPVAQQIQDSVTAAVYLFALTGDAAFSDYVTRNFRATRPFQDDRWSIYFPPQGDALLYYAALPGADAATKQAIVERKTSELRDVDLYGFHPAQSLYRAWMSPDMYHWGSNNQRAALGNASYDAVVHALVSGPARANYEERAAGMLHSFHGVNAMQFVYLTNMYAFGGDACADELFHTWFRHADPTWGDARSSRLGPAPGYVTGGPNKQYCAGQDPTQNACAKSPLRAQPAEKAYVDSNTGYEPQNPYDKSWELTEPGIYYQASYVRLVSKFVE
jgi:hypothetical protein